MNTKVDLTKGSILKTLIMLSLPILGTSFIQMTYSLVDMMWIGKIGSEAVAAVGTASFFTWFGNSLVMVTKIGAEVGVSQSCGRKNHKERDKYIYNSLFMCIVISIIYMVILITLKKQFIGFFKLGDTHVIEMALSYLVIIAFGMISAFLNPQFSGILTSSGNSKIPFAINTIGLVINIILDPILIFGVGNIKAMGVVGAAIATVIAQIVVSILFIIVFINHGYKVNKNTIEELDIKIMKNIVKWGSPSAMQNCLFSFFAMIIGRIIAVWGATPIAVQKIGSQIESISWMTAEGFGSALTAFVGQNYGANEVNRVKEGYKKTIFISSLFGIFATLLLIFGGEWLFSLFINEEEAIKQGADYLRILGYSQLFMCLEISTTGAFFGVGRTFIPSIVSVLFTGLRIPMAILLSKPELLGINGVWWSISSSSIFKGIILVLMFYLLVLRKLEQKQEAEKICI